jgi:hypothetical protein
MDNTDVTINARLGGLVLAGLFGGILGFLAGLAPWPVVLVLVGGGVAVGFYGRR